MQVRKQQLELDMEQQTGSKYEKEYVKAVYCHPAYLNQMADKTRPWSSTNKWNDTPRDAMTVPRHCQKTNLRGGPNPGNLHPFPEV